jgi:ADP-ribose pyrophosphatase YjhB (NUDIX family)
MNYASRRWTTPGGRIEPGESINDALTREVREETGLEVEAIELLGAYAKPHKDDVVLSVRARIVAQHPWQPDNEIAEVGYFGLAELPQPMGAGARARIIDALQGRSGVVRVMGPSDDGL